MDIVQIGDTASYGAQKCFAYTRFLDPCSLKRTFRCRGSFVSPVSTDCSCSSSSHIVSGKFPRFNSPGFCVEVTASVCGESVLVAGAGNLRCRG